MCSHQAYFFVVLVAGRAFADTSCSNLYFMKIQKELIMKGRF